MKGIVALFVAVVLGLVAVLGVRAFMKNKEEEYLKRMKPVDIVVAAKRIEAGTKITSAMIEKQEVPEAQIDPDSILIRDANAIIGAVTAQPIDRDQAIKWSFLQRERPKLSTALPAGMVAVTIPVDNVSGVAYNVRPGSRVDIIGSFTMNQTGAAGGAAAGAAGVNTAAMVTRRLFTHVLVLAIDNRMTKEDEVSLGGQSTVRYSTITFAATPEESVLLTFARQQGTLTLAIRNPTDDLSPEPPEVSLKNIFPLCDNANKTRRQRVKESESTLSGVTSATEK